MSYRSLCNQRCTVWRLQPTNVDGAVLVTWTEVATDVPVRVDTFGRSPQSGPQFVPEAGTPSDLSGRAFFWPNTPARPGDRIELTKRGKGNYALGGKFVEVPGRRGSLHHIEAEVEEVATPFVGAP